MKLAYLLALAPAVALAQTAPPGGVPDSPPSAVRAHRGPQIGAAATRPADAATLAGTVDSFNYSPRGMPDSLMLTTADKKTVQVNFPPELATAITAAVQVGQSIGVEAMPAPARMTEDSDHPIYMASTITPTTGNPIIIRGNGKPIDFAGTVQRLNYSARGTVNGFVLDGGQIVLLPPGPDAADVKVGDKVTGKAMEPAPAAAAAGVKILMARQLNGTDLQPGGAGGTGGPGGMGGPPGGPGGPDGGPPPGGPDGAGGPPPPPPGQ
jgi:hypothetical protein